MALSIEQLQQRQQCEIAGMFKSKALISMYYTSIEGLDIEEAMPKIKLECELRGIPWDEPIAPPPAPPKDWFGKAEDMFAKVNALANKYPIIIEVGRPVFDAGVAAVVAGIAGLGAGKAIADSNDDNDMPDTEIVVEDIPTMNTQQIEMVEPIDNMELPLNTEDNLTTSKTE